MPTNIDQRIVEMQFDNAQFEKGVSTSLQSLENLKKSLNLDSALTSISNIEKSFNKMNFDSVAESINSIAGHFTALGRNVDKIVDNMVQSAISKLTSIGKSISVDQIGAGFSKYADQTKAVQTITNATGKSVEEVEVVLSKLQKYTDETSYDFTTMASTIGKFTSVGVELERAELAMEGIANEAALSGAGKAEANRAMYNFAQSLSSGSVKLIDWKSIENANMATKEFKEELIKTAIELGTINKTSETTGSIMKQTKAATSKTAAQFKETEVNYKSFNETLSEGWLTSDVLITTLARYADSTQGVGEKAYIAAQKALTWTDAIEAIKDAVSSSWMQSFKYIFGDLNEAIDLWTNFCNAIIEVTDAIGSYRNEILQGWHEQGGYNDMIETASNLWTALTNVMDLVRDAFNSIIPPATSQSLLDFTSNLKELSENLKNLFNYNGITDVEEEVEKLANYATEFKDEIKSGMSGDYVKLFQKALIGAGYSLDKYGADGIYGTETQNAIKRLQKDLGIEETGKWDEATQKAAILSGKFQAIEKATETVTKNIGDTYTTIESMVEEVDYSKLIPIGLKKGDTGDAVANLQKMLTYLGMFTDEELAAGVTFGVFGQETENALKRLQKQYGITQTGIYDGYTRIWAESSKSFTVTETIYKEVVHEIGAQNSYMERLYTTMQGVAAAWSIVTKLFNLGVKVVTYFGSLFSPVVDGLLTIASAIGTCFVSLNDFLDSSGAYDKWFNTIKGVLQPFGALLQRVGDAINGFFSRNNKIKTFTDLWKALRTELSKSQVWKNILTYLENFVKFVDSARKVIVGLYDTAKKWISGKFAELFTKGKDGVTGLKKAFTDTVNSIKAKFDELSKKYPILTILVDKFNTVKKAITDFWESAKKTFSSFFDSMGNFNASTFLSWVTERFEEIKKSISSFVTNSKNKFDEFKSNIVDLFTQLKSKITELRKKYPMLDKIIDVFTRISSSISTVASDIKNIFIKSFSSSNLDKKTIFEVIQEKIEQLKTSFSSVFTYIKIRITKFKFTNPSFSKAIDFISNAFESVKEFVSALTESIKNLFTTDFSNATSFGDKIASAFEAFKPLVDWFMSIKDKLASAWNDGKASLTSIAESTSGNGLFATIVENVKNLAKQASKIDLNKYTWPIVKLLGAYFALTITKAISRVGKSFAAIGSGVSGLTKAMSSFIGTDTLGGIVQNVISSISKNAKERPKDSVGTTFMKMAASMAIVAAAVAVIVYALSKIENYDKAREGIHLFGTVLTALSGVMIVMGVVSKIAPNAANVGYSVLALTGSLLLIAASIWAMLEIVKNNNQNTLNLAITIIAGFLLGLAIIQTALNNSESSKGGSKISGVLQMCAGLLLIAIAFGSITNTINKYIDKPGVLKNAFAVLAILIAELGIISILIAKSNTGKAKISGILSMSIGLILIVNSFSTFVSIYDKYGPDKFKAAFIMFEALLVTVFGLSALISKNSSGLKGSISSVATLIAMAYSMKQIIGAFTEALVTVKDVDTTLMITFFAGVETAMGVLAGIVTLFGNMPVAALLGSAGIVVVFTALGAAVDIFATLGSDALDKFSTAIWVLGSKLKNFSSMIENVNFDLFQKVVDGIKILVSIFTETDIGLVSKDSVEGFSLAIQSLGSALNNFNTSVSKIEDWSIFSSDGSVITGIKNLASLINSSDIVKANPQYGINFALAIQKIASGLANASASLGAISLDSYTVGGSLHKAVSTLLYIIRTIVSENIAGSSTTSGFSNAIQELGGGLANSYTNVKDIPSGAFDNAKTLVDSSVEIIYKLNNPLLWAASKSISTTLEEVSGALALYYKNIKDIDFDEGGATPEQIKAAFTGLANNMPDESSITDVAKYANDTEGSQNLLDFAEGLVNLGSAIKQYGESIGTLNSTNVSTANNVLETVSGLKESLTISSFLGLATELINHEKSDPIGDFATDITILGSALENYASSIGGKLTKTDVENSNSVLETVAGITTTLSDTSIFFGFIGFTTSNKDTLSNFATDIETLGSALENYGKHLYNSNLTSTKVNLANDVLKTVAETSVTLTDDSNFFQFMGWVPDKNDVLSKFANNIGQLGSALENYADGIGGLSWVKVTTANTVLEKVTGLDIKATGGLWGLLSGDASLSTFASNLGSIGDGIAQFSNAIAGSSIDKIDMEKSLKPLNTLADAQAKLEKTGGLSALISGENNLGKLGSQFKEFGEYIAAFSTEVLSFNEDRINSIMSVLGRVNVLYEKLKGESDVGYKLGDLGAGIYTFLSQLDQASNFQDRIESWKNTGSDLVSSFISGFQMAVNEENKQKIKSSMTILLFQGTKAITDSTGIFKTNIENLIQNGIVKSINSSLRSVNSAFVTMIDVARASLNNKYSDFKSVGEYLSWGLAMGIWRHNSTVTDMAVRIANNAYNAARNSLQIRSPSRKFAEIGMYADLGFAKGLEEYSDRVTQSASSVSDNALAGAQQGLSDFYSMVFDNISDEPVIRPVLDLSEVQAGASAMNGMFGSQTIGVRSAAIANTIAVGTARNEMNLSASTDNTEIKGTLEALNSRIDELGQRISNMQVVTETGAIIGQITNGIDKALGKKAYMASRGV